MIWEFLDEFGFVVSPWTNFGLNLLLFNAWENKARISYFHIVQPCMHWSFVQKVMVVLVLCLFVSSLS